MKPVIHSLCAAACLLGLAAARDKADKPKPAPVPACNPAKQPVSTGEVPVGLIVVEFKESAMPRSFSDGMEAIRRIKGISQEQYYKIYSNGIVWPAIMTIPNDGVTYQAPQFYGYYCEYDYWRNPIGWKSREDGDKRAAQMKKDALQFVTKQYRGGVPRVLCYNYITTRPAKPAKEITAQLAEYYGPKRGGGSGERSASRRPRKSQAPAQPGSATDPWAYYAPACRWGDPLWPNSSMQIHDFSSGAFAHEFGHVVGAPDVYHLGRFNDGIGNAASLLAYGPTANSFSRFYHHAFIKEKNHPTIKTSGSYTLYPRHIEPKGDEAVGYLIPSSHPHYLYHVEYVHGENNTVGVGASHEGMLISVVNLGLENFLGSPDYYYVYRPGDPFFRGRGDTGDCLFGKRHKRTEFNMTTEPSSRLPNLIDGGVSFKNILENNGTLTFEVVIDRKPISGSAYTNSMLPQIRLDEIQDIQATGFTLNCTIKFRGEPLKTAYGFCWSTRANPTVKDETYALAHRECYRGHAINLKPGTTYYVRAFATNGLGVRYSDEEKTVKTLDPRTPPATIGPLCTDSFSDNDYLYAHFSSESTETTNTFIGYSPTCVLAKLIAYYRPAKFAAGADAKGKTTPVNFNNLSWNPDWDDFPMRLEEIRSFFGAIYRQSRQLGLHDPKPGKDFLKNLVKLSGVNGKPVLTECTAANTREATELIRNDLVQSRPAILMLAYATEGMTTPCRWAMIDGINAKGDLHVDFPRNTTIHTPAGEKKLNPGYYSPSTLVYAFYKTYLITSLQYKP